MTRRPAPFRPRERPDRTGLPDRHELVRYVAEHPDEVTPRDLARAFGVKGSARTDLRRMLRDLQGEGLLERGRKKRVRPAGRLPGVAVLEIVEVDEDGEVLARPATSDARDVGEVRITFERSRGPAPGVGERVLTKLTHLEGDAYSASVIRVLPGAPKRVVGRIEGGISGLRVVPIDRKGGPELVLNEADAEGARPGELVSAERISGAALGLGRARVIERLGDPEDPRAISVIAAVMHDLPLVFPDAAESQAEAAAPVELGNRADLRDLPLVTIDGADARDFDDAVFAEPDPAADNPGGWRLLVAIADVAHYVRPGDALDLEAKKRGNSVYFPDRVIPMLPHALSSDLCSLRPDEERACLAVRMTIDARGRLRAHRFQRGLMRSRARLTYEQVQAAADGQPDHLTAPLVSPVVEPLYGAFRSLLADRHRRGTLDLDIPELGVRIGEDGRPAEIAPRPRLDSHRLIEEFMIAANVAAAHALEGAGMPCMYRVHDKPDPIKLEGLADLLERLGLGGGRGSLGRPKDLARLLERVRGSEIASTVGSMVLRAQAQAQYSPHNIGHYGLNLGHYAHFTSPIRRYADLLVHRALIRGLKLGAGGPEDDVSSDAWQDLGGWLSRTERRAMEAERQATSRFVALYMSEHIGSVFAGTVVSVQRFGAFVQLDGTQADGLIPVARLGQGWFTHDASHHALIGEGRGEVIALGDRVIVRLTEANPLSGQLTFDLHEHTPGPAALAALKAGRKGGRPPQRPLRHRRTRR